MEVEVLKAKGVPEDHILFLNLIASPSGVADFARRFPKLRVVTAFIDQGLDEKKRPEFISFILSRTDAHHIIPGLGDFGDSYYTIGLLPKTVVSNCTRENPPTTWNWKRLPVSFLFPVPHQSWLACQTEK